jgi:hypothetical protein
MPLELNGILLLPRHYFQSIGFSLFSNHGDAIIMFPKTSWKSAMPWKFAACFAAVCIATMATLAPADARPGIKVGKIKRAYCTYGVIHFGRCVRVISHGRVRN